MRNRGRHTVLAQTLFAAIACLALLGSRTWALDLTEIDRSMVEGPVGLTKTSRYCLLVFGPKAQTRYWLILDCDVLYLDRTGAGGRTASWEKIKLSSTQPVKDAPYME
ncbi:MAG TPA: hypothetical protein VN281_02475, partial [Verrucomicrobiae bacterium]|nr:hypothetical protein [Verrucomicrobiae bacterium]